MKKLAFVLSGGGARGALQVGALRALLEAEIYPDMLVGTSIGAVNATYLATQGVSLDSIDGLVEAWESASQLDLLPTNYFRLALQSFTQISRDGVYQRMQDFFISQGLTSGIRFNDIDGVSLVLVATDLNSGGIILYGPESELSILDCVMDSITLPPWIMPNKRGEHLLMDGGLISNLPIEPALKCGAEKIIALDLNDLREPPLPGPEVGKLITKLLFAVAKRQTELELALAEESQIPVLRINLLGDKPIALWDFQHTRELIDRGYETMKSKILELVEAL
ncbi:MAG: patatin-like phospholipase family protein [Anaerolineales bacterium]